MKYIALNDTIMEKLQAVVKTDTRHKKGLFMPKEGVGLSNFETINFFHLPNFKKASFPLDNDKEIQIKIIYFQQSLKNSATLKQFRFYAQVEKPNVFEVDCFG